MIHRFDYKGLKVRDRTEGEWFSNFWRVLATSCGVCLSVYNSLTNQKAQSMNDPRRSFRSWNELLLVSNFRSRSIGPCTLKQCSEDNVSYWRIFCHGRNFRKRLIKNFHKKGWKSALIILVKRVLIIVPCSERDATYHYLSGTG